jgi:ribosomal protein S18 acetylase RimI-like enzyme
VSPDELLQTFHRRVRLSDADNPPGWIAESDGPARRAYLPDPASPAFIESPEGLGDDPDGLIRRQRDFFAGRGQKVEWKTYAYDGPADLTDRLSAAGFVAEEPEALVLGEVDRLLGRPGALPSKVRIRDVTEPQDFDRIGVLNKTVFGKEESQVAEQLQAELRADAALLVVSVVEEVLAGPDGPALTAGWLRLHPGTGFASFWGGGTLPEWRRQGLYRALVAHRARIAKERGYEFIRVDASPDSRPILERLGLHVVTTTTPYVFTP